MCRGVVKHEPRAARVAPPTPAKKRMGEFQRWNTHHSHVVPLEVCGHQLNIAQDPTSDNLGTTIWDASVILVRYMERNPQLYSRRRLEGKRVLELGAGCGLAGMFFALQGAHVTFTDLMEVVPLLQRNVTMNLGGQAMEAAESASGGAGGKGSKAAAATPTAPATRAKANVLEYDWGRPLDALSPPYDYIVACDCVYVERLVESLVWSMAQCSGRGTTVLVASEKREEITYAKFRERLSEDFTVRQVPRRHMDKAYDHENSEVLLCKLRRTYSSSKGKYEGEGGKGVGSCDVAEEAVPVQVSEGVGTMEFVVSDDGLAPAVEEETVIAARATGAAATAEGDAERLSLSGVTLSPSQSGGPTGVGLLKTVGAGDPIR